MCNCPIGPALIGLAVVTGASGWLGRNLVRALVAQGRDRCGRWCQPADEAPLLEVISASRSARSSGDVRDPAALDRLFDGSPARHGVPRGGGDPPARPSREFFDVNVGGTELVVDQARARAARPAWCTCRRTRRSAPTPRPTDRFTEDSPFDPYMGYGESKLEAEQIVQRAPTSGATSTP